MDIQVAVNESLNKWDLQTKIARELLEDISVTSGDTITLPIDGFKEFLEGTILVSQENKDLLLQLSQVIIDGIKSLSDEVTDIQNTLPLLKK
jgi:hypothetical protein